MKEPADILDRILSDDIEMLEKWIREVQAKIESRTELTKRMMSLLVKDVDKLETIEERLGIWAPGYKPSIDKMRSDIRSQINIIKNNARNEELTFWRDVSGLEKELRILQHALEKAKRKKGLMDL